MNAKGLVFEPSAPNTQSQNGAAERSGGVIKDKSRAMRGKLPTEMWREYVRAAIYLYNRTPRRFNAWKTPYESLLRHRPTLQHLKAYGCKAFAMTDKAQLKQERKKRLESKAWIGYLVGYTSTNIYRVWVPLIGRVINTRDVVFNEDDFFNGDLQCLKDDAKDTDLALLSQKLQEIALADDTAVHEEEHATSGGETEAFDDEGIIDFDDPPQALVDSQELSTQPSDPADKFQPFPTPPETPPTALFSAALPFIYALFTTGPPLLKPRQYTTW